MMRVTISGEAHRLIDKSEFRTPGVSLSGGIRLPDGKWSIPLKESTYEQLNDYRLEGESFSDLIIRLFHLLEKEGLQ